MGQHTPLPYLLTTVQSQSVWWSTTLPVWNTHISPTLMDKQYTGAAQCSKKYNIYSLIPRLHPGFQCATLKTLGVSWDEASEKYKLMVGSTWHR